MRVQQNPQPEFEVENEISKKISKPVSNPISTPLDSRFIDVTEELPSKFVFYTFDSLSVRPLTLMELKKIYKAYVTQNFGILVEAIAPTVNQPIGDLTQGDFWWIMHWQRLNSYKRSPLNVKWTCNAEPHVAKVGKGVLTEDSLQNELIITKTSLDVAMVDGESVAAYIESVKEDYNLYLYPPTVLDMVDTTKLLNEEPISHDTVWISKYASCLNRGYGATLADRMRYLETADLPPDFIECVDKFLELCHHGVSESCAVTCKGCGASTVTKVAIDALTFFPSLQ